MPTLEEIKKYQWWETRGGGRALISGICDSCLGYPVVGFIRSGGGYESASWTNSGRYDIQQLVSVSDLNRPLPDCDGWRWVEKESLLKHYGHAAALEQDGSAVIVSNLHTVDVRAKNNENGLTVHGPDTSKATKRWNACVKALEALENSSLRVEDAFKLAEAYLRIADVANRKRLRIEQFIDELEGK